MATTARLLRASNSSCRLGPPSSTCSSRPLKCFNKLASETSSSSSSSSGPWINGETSNVQRSKLQVAAKTVASDRYFIASDPISGTVGRGMEMIWAVFGLVLSIRNALVTASRRSAVLLKTRKFNLQMFIERTIVDCRFFTLFAVAGSLLGSVLCFFEGCRFILKSYIHYFSSLSGASGQGHLMQLLMEAIDMFMLGNALLIFGVGIYIMFVGSNDSKEEELWLPGSHFFGFFEYKSIPRWANMQSVTQAKSKIGHAILMILQVGLLDKLKQVPIVTCLDLACFGATILVSSAGIFLLSRLSGETTWN